MNDRLKALCDKHGVEHTAGDTYLESLQQHIAFVQEEGEKLGVPSEQLMIHDKSKFSEYEFPFYARNFHGSVSPVDLPVSDMDFAAAWLHHENFNPHHWGYWIPRSGKFAGKPLVIPEKYVREMVADWLGASRAYTGSPNMSKWLNEGFGDMKIHAETRHLVLRVLAETGHTLAWGNFEYKETQ